MKSTKNKIAIIGGGIGGLTLGLTLKRNNIPFKLFEKSKKFKEVGAGIGLASNALKIFDKLNVGDTLRTKGHLIKRTVFADEKLNIIKTVPFPDEVYCVHRASIIEVLSNELNKTSYELGKEVEEIENEENVKIKFNDNKILEFNTLIASDGINSTIRKSVFPKIKVRAANQIIWRGITDFDISPDLNNTYYELFGGSLRFLFLPLNDTQVFWLAVQEKKNFTKDSSTSLKNYLIDAYKDFAPLVLTLLNKTSNKDILENKVDDIKPNYKNWFKNNTVFIGDSIHATTPNLGQGACQAIEDAYTLGTCINNNPNNSFIKYQNLRQKKVKYIVKMSWQIGKMSLGNNILQKKLFHSLLTLYPVKLYQRRFNRITNIEYLNKL